LDSGQKSIAKVDSGVLPGSDSAHEIKQTNESLIYAPSQKLEKRQSNYDPITASQPSYDPRVSESFEDRTKLLLKDDSPDVYN